MTAAAWLTLASTGLVCVCTVLLVRMHRTTRRAYAQLTLAWHEIRQAMGVLFSAGGETPPPADWQARIAAQLFDLHVRLTLLEVEKGLADGAPPEDDDDV
jgi:hypothetical protein